MERKTKIYELGIIIPKENGDNRKKWGVWLIDSINNKQVGPIKSMIEEFDDFGKILQKATILLEERNMEIINITGISRPAKLGKDQKERVEFYISTR